jgi:hypothetical protein
MKFLHFGTFVLILFLLNYSAGFGVDQNIFFNSPLTQNDSFYAENELNKDILVDQSLINLEANLMPSFLLDSLKCFKILGMTNGNTVTISLVMSILFLILAYKIKISMDIYEFYNKDKDGTIKFNDVQMIKDYYQNCVKGDIYLGSGLFFGLTSILFWML